MAVPSLWQNAREYLKSFLNNGGGIEAVPNATNLKPFAVSFLIEPDG
jgi:hypothetical protein